MTRWLRGLTGLTLTVVASAALVAPSFAVTSRTISLSMPSSATTGATIAVHGYLTHSPVGSLILIRRKSGTSWIQVAAARTKTSAGAYAHSVPAPTTRGTYYYDAYAPGTSTLAGAVSNAYAVIIRTKVRVALTSSTTTPSPLTAVTLSGTVAPWRSGTPVFLEHMAAPATTWSKVASLSPNSAGHFNRSVNPTVNTTNRYRVVVSTRGYYTGASSPIVAVTPQDPPSLANPVTAASATPHDPGASIFLTWNPVSLSGAATVVIRRLAGAHPPASPTDGASVFTVTTSTQSADSFVDANAQPGTQYSYSWFYSDGAGRWSSAVSASAVAPSPPLQATWATPTVNDPAVGDGWKMSCSGPSFCMLSNGLSYQTFNGTSWSTPVAMPMGMRIPSALSCGSPTLCLIVNSTDWSRYNGSDWSGVQPLSSALAGTAPQSPVALACSTSTFCLLVGSDATGSGQSSSYDGNGWTTHSGADVAVGFETSNLYCLSTTWCTTSPGGQQAIWNGSGWTPSSLNAPQSLWCSATDNCVGITAAGTPAVLQPGSGSFIYSTPLWPLENGQSPAYNAQIGCMSSTNCVAIADVNHSGSYEVDVASYNGSTWTQPTKLFDGDSNAHLACTPNSCLALAHPRSAFTGEDERTLAFGIWSPTHRINQDNLDIAVGCETGGTCFLADQRGNVRALGSNGWGPQTSVDPGHQVTALACGTSTVCALVDADGGVVMHGSAGWSARQSIDAGHLVSVTCAPDGSCAAIDSNTNVVRYENGVWGSAQVVTPDPALNTQPTIACGSANYCEVGDAGRRWLNEGSGWSLVGKNGASDMSYGAASCPAATTCVVSGVDDTVCGSTSASWLTDGNWATRPIAQWNGRDNTCGHPPLTDAMACPSTNYCISAVAGAFSSFSQTGANARALVSDVPQPPSFAMTAISCAGMNLCVALDQVGDTSVGTP